MGGNQFQNLGQKGAFLYQRFVRFFSSFLKVAAQKAFLASPFICKFSLFTYAYYVDLLRTVAACMRGHV
jgi:hypothetical protein